MAMSEQLTLGERRTLVTHPSAIARWHRDLRDMAERILKPRPTLKVSEWARTRRHFAQGSPAAGPYDPARVPYLVEIMDAVADPSVERIVVMKPARSGFTEGVIVNGIGYLVDLRPTQILGVFPTRENAEKFSKQKLEPAFDESPILRSLIPSRQGRDANNTILYKRFPGGFMQFVGANSPRHLRQIDAAYVFVDEVDANPRSSGKEGDVIELAATRAANVEDRKIVVGSSPSWKGTSRIEELYLQTDQRRWLVPCPNCGELQVLMWGGKDQPFGVKWASRRADTAFYLCIKGCRIEQRHKRAMNAGGRWIAQQPDVADRGYWWNQLVSQLEAGDWRLLVRKWLAAQVSSETLQVFVNAELAETFELKGEVVIGNELMARREVYPAEVPAGVGLLTGMVDVHDDRLEVLVRGWGAGRESWRILHAILLGDPDGQEVWDSCDGILLRTYEHELGASMRIRVSLVDSGDRTTRVYAYTRGRQKRNVFASKGDKADPKAPIVQRGKKPMQGGIKLMTIGTFSAKRTLFANLKIQTPGPRYMHFNQLAESAPIEQRAAFDAQDLQYFTQFEAEKLLPDKDRFGRPYYRYQQIADDNHSIDLEVGCLAALYATGPTIYERLEREVARMATLGAQATAAAIAHDAPSAPIPARRHPPRRSFATRWKY